jgi:hypothetical protein
MLIDPVVEHSNVIGVSETTILGTPAWAVPGQTVLQEGFKDHPGHLSVRHQTLFVLPKIRFFMNLKIM